jgi:hypothetical protein
VEQRSDSLFAEGFTDWGSDLSVGIALLVDFVDTGLSDWVLLFGSSGIAHNELTALHGTVLLFLHELTIAQLAEGVLLALIFIWKEEPFDKLFVINEAIVMIGIGTIYGINILR